MRRLLLGTALATLCGLGGIKDAGAVACPVAIGSCTLDGQTFTVTGAGLPTSGNGLTFLAEFTTQNQSNANVATPVIDFLAALGISGVTYLGRQDGSGSPASVTVTANPNGGLTGSWTLSPGFTGDIGSYVALHAGNGQTEELYAINSPGLSGTWQTGNGHGLSNFDLFGTRPPPSPPTNTPEPASLVLLGGGLAMLGFARFRRK